MRTELRLFTSQFRRELLIQLRQMRVIVNSCLFLLMMLILFPLTLKPETVLLRAIGPGLIWMAFLLSLLVSAERVFQHDYEQGC